MVNAQVNKGLFFFTNVCVLAHLSTCTVADLKTLRPSMGLTPTPAPWVNTFNFCRCYRFGVLNLRLFLKCRILLFFKQILDPLMPESKISIVLLFVWYTHFIVLSLSQETLCQYFKNLNYCKSSLCNGDLILFSCRVMSLPVLYHKCPALSK